MTDKQINYEQNSVIIDDIDVSECVYYKATGKYDSCGYYCEQNPNCYYKQLKRSEAQCEGMFVSHTDLEKKYKTLEEENRSLKKQLQFEFDETLLQYSNTIEDLQKQLNNTVMQKCPQCGEVYLNPVGCELHEENQQLKAENKIQKETIDGFLIILDKLGKSNIRLRETFTEIKEIVEQGIKIHDDIIVSKKVLQIIDEVENGHTKED